MGIIVIRVPEDCKKHFFGRFMFYDDERYTFELLYYNFRSVFKCLYLNMLFKDSNVC